MIFTSLCYRENTAVFAFTNIIKGIPVKVEEKRVCYRKVHKIQGWRIPSLARQKRMKDL